MITRLQAHLTTLVRDGLDDRGMTESELAAAVGISTRCLAALLNGDATGSLAVWDKLLWHLMIPVSVVG